MLQDHSQKWRVSNQDKELMSGNFLLPKRTVRVRSRVTYLAATKCRRRLPICEGTDSGEGVEYVVWLPFFPQETLISYFFDLKIYFSHFCFFLKYEDFSILELHAVKKSWSLEALSDVAIDCQMCKPAGGREQISECVHPDTMLLYKRLVYQVQHLKKKLLIL